MIGVLSLKEWSFRRPLFIGDTVHVNVEFLSRRITGDGVRYIVERQPSLLRGEGEVIQDGIAAAMLLLPPELPKGACLMMVLSDAVERNAWLRGPLPAFLFEGQSLSHAAFARRAFALGNALTLAATRDGWFRTGDIGFLDARGFLFIADRLKDMIISGGKNNNSRAVEDVLMAHPAVHEASVMGVADPEWGENVKAWVVLRPDRAANAQTLIEHCQSLIASCKKPRTVAFTADLPRLFHGKVDKRPRVRWADAGPSKSCPAQGWPHQAPVRSRMSVADSSLPSSSIALWPLRKGVWFELG